MESIPKKDWTGNHNSVMKTLGSSHRSDEERHSHDFYATPPVAAEWLLKLESFNINIWECACGEGHLSRVLEDHFYDVKSSDLVDRGFGQGGVDFLGIEVQTWNGDIITNPPYIYAKEFIIQALRIIPEGNKVAMFLKLQFMEGKGRKSLFKKFPPSTIYVSSSRITCVKNGDFEKYQDRGAIAYGWFVWVKGFKGNTIVKWFN